MKAKRVLAVLLTVSLVAGMAAGCGKKKESSSKSEDGVTELTFYNVDLQEDDPWTDPVAEALTEATGVKLKTDHPVGEDKQKISLMIAEQKFPDIIYAKGWDAIIYLSAMAGIDQGLYEAAKVEI